MTLGYGNYAMQEISSAPGYAFVVPNQPNLGVNGVPIPAVGKMTPKSTAPVPAYVPQKDNTGNYIMAGAAATAAIMLGILALKKGKKPNLPKNTPAPKPTPKKIDINTPEIQAARKAKAPEIAQRTAEEAAQKQVQRTLAVDYARQADRDAVYAAHIGTNEPAKIRPELAILKDSMLTRAARNTKKKQGIFQRAKNAVVNLYENTRGKIRRAMAQRRLNKAAQGTRGKDIIQVEPTQEQLKQMAFNRSVERGSKVIDSHVATEAETRAAKSEAHRIIAQASNTPYGTTITDKGSISLVRPELRELKQSMIEHAKRQAETPDRVIQEKAKELVKNVTDVNFARQVDREAAGLRPELVRLRQSMKDSSVIDSRVATEAQTKAAKKEAAIAFAKETDNAADTIRPELQKISDQMFEQAANRANANERIAKETAKKQVQRTLDVNFARQADRNAAYAAHIGTNEPTQLRPELQILRQSMLTRAARNTEKKPGFFQRAKKEIVSLYENTRGKIRRAKARSRLLKASNGMYSSKINDARKYAQVQGDNFIFY